MKIIIGLLCCLMAPVCFGVQIEAKMLGNGMAVLIIDGQQRFLREGARSPEGVLLVSANTRQAVLEIEGKRKNITLSHAIGTQFRAADKTEIRIAGSNGGHHRTSGLINGTPVEFLVDTGASLVAMNYLEAERLHIDYRAGKQIRVDTANGRTSAFLVTLPSVSVGNIVVNQVEAAVSTTESPSVILLGNSYLSKVDLTIDQGVMVLKEK